MAWLTLIITIPFTIFAALFAISNGQSVSVMLSPFEGKVEWPLSAVGLSLLLAGFFCGAVFVWLQAQKTRFKLWQETRRADRLEKELDLAHKKAEEARAALPALETSAPLGVK